MNPRIKKVVLVVQDLQTKDKENVAVLSGDIHLNTTDKIKVISFQMLLADNKDFNRAINGVILEALSLHEKKVNK